MGAWRNTTLTSVIILLALTVIVLTQPSITGFYGVGEWGYVFNRTLRAAEAEKMTL